MGKKTILVSLAIAALALSVALPVLTTQPVEAAGNPCNPCGGKKAENPCNPCGGKAMNPCNPCGEKAKAAVMPAVNPCHAKMGTVFYIADPMARNTISFASRAPLEDIIGTTNQVQGYIVFDPKNPKNGGHGKLVVPTSSLKTGIPLRDEHLASKDWLDAARYGDIVFTIDSVKNVKVVKKTPEYQTYELQVGGSFTLHGKVQRIEFPARITYLKESKQTKQKMPGDLLAGRAKFDLSLRQFGVSGFDGVIGSKVSDTISVEVSFMGTSKKPGALTAGNPCNPCGGKAKNPCNPCNPCGGKAKSKG